MASNLLGLSDYCTRGITSPWSGQAAVESASIAIASCLPLRGSVSLTNHSMREQGVPCIHAGGEAVLVRLLKGCKNKRNVTITGYACAVLPSLFRADNVPRVIG